MKNFWNVRFARVLGIIALVAVIGFGVAACKEEDDGGGGSWNGTWKDSDNPNFTVTINGDDITITDGSKTLNAKLGEEKETTTVTGTAKWRDILEGAKVVGSATYIEYAGMELLAVSLEDSSVFSDYVNLTCKKS